MLPQPNPGLRRKLMRGMIVGLIAGVFLALSGAFGSGGAPLWLRLVYWIPLLVFGGFWSLACSPLLDRMIDTTDRPWLEVGLISLMMSVPVTLMVWLSTALIFWHEPLQAAHLLHFFVPVLIITLIMTALNVVMARQSPVETHQHEDQAPALFLKRLPPKLIGASLWAVQAEDHYLRLHTDKGTDLILMRLSDALSELDGLEGAQTHRSWWIAREAVRDVARGDGRATLTLPDGTQVPVSRRHARILREAGWW